MPTPELGLAAFESGVKSVELLIFIIKTAQGVIRLKTECDEVKTIASILKEVLENNQDAMKDQKSFGRLQKILEEVSKFVVECKQGSVIHRAWEVMWKHRLPRLLKEMMIWVAILNVGTAVSTRSDLWKLVTSLDENQHRQQAFMADISSKLEILDELKKNLDEKPCAGLSVNFSESDSRLSVVKENDNLLCGELLLANARNSPLSVTCEPVKEDLMRFGEKGPRHILIYAQITAHTLVHPFYGIAQRFGKRWVVMKDLRKAPTLAGAIQDGKLPQSTLERLGIAHEVAKTVVYLHSVEVLVKRLSDKTVLLTSENGTFKPYLTDLENARLFKENTSGGEYDIRYEAPEIQKMPKPQHSIYTDAWSLGIFIWECVSATYPFSYSKEVTEGSEAAKIRQLVCQGEFSWKGNSRGDPILDQTVRLVKRCCNTNPAIRPSAADVAHSLFDIMTMAIIKADPDAPIDESVKDRVSEMLETPDKSGLRLAGDDAIDLRNLVKRGDPTAAFLLGSAMWYRLTEPEHDADQLLLIAGEDSKQELRARSALPHLEFALQAGIKAAAKPLMQVHGALMQLYRVQALQYRDMKSL